ncbi:phage tail fiber repeat family protein, partial [Escherichia coli DEC13D]
TSATDSPSETLAATAKAVKIAMDNANARLAKAGTEQIFPISRCLSKTSVYRKR